MSVLEVACAVEGGYVPHSAAMLDSVLAHSGGLPVRVHSLHGPDFSARDARAIEAMVATAGGSSSFVAVDDARCNGLPTKGFTGKATWYRVMLPDLLPQLDRVLCLDADLIVTDSLAPLWDTDIEDFFLAAVTNVLAPQYMSRPAALGVSPNGYFNAGVMLLNLGLMREHGCSERIVRYGIDHAPELALRDQDALNFALADRRRPLDPRWNSMNALRAYPWSSYVFTPEEIAAAIERPAIRHFEGPGSNKPWHAGCDARSRELYREHRQRTPWPDFELERDPALGAVRNRLRKLRDMARLGA